MRRKSLAIITIILSLFLMVGCFNGGGEKEGKYYTVTFVGRDGSTLKTEQVKEGESATAPTTLPEVDDYVFSNWDKSFDAVNGDLRITAVYRKLKDFTVIFLDKEGVILKIATVREGSEANAPTPPTVEGYEFTNWDVDFSNITSNLNVTAVYKEKTYTVKFLGFDDAHLKTEEVVHLNAATAPVAPEVEGYNFTGWDKEFDEITNNLIVKAVYEKIIKKYTVTFLTIDEGIIRRVEVNEGEAAEAPNAPTVLGHNFLNWDIDFSNVTSDLTVRPIYEKRTYNIIFVSDGIEIETQQITFQEDATPPTVEKEGYKFIGWDEDTTNIFRHLTVNAMWQKIIYASYVSEFALNDYTPYTNLLETIEVESNLNYTFENVKYGGPRGTNELVYYDETLTHNTNIYGLEVAINSEGIVIEKATKVTIPVGGFVLSGHGTSNTLLNNRVRIGDYITYANNEAKLYRNFQISNIVGLAIELDKVEQEIINANNEMWALDYVEIENMYNETISVFNGLLEDYVAIDYKRAEELILTMRFMLIEPKSATVRAMWHYPARSTTTYNEMNTFEVQKFLNKAKSIGINRIYLNTNFGGFSVYPSEYLSHRITVNYTYEGYDDYLHAFISEAHLRGIEVYAWTNTLICGDGWVSDFYKTKGWLLKGFNDEDNYNGMYYLDISNDEVQEFLSDIFYELASKYDLDGFEYDFIRYPVTRTYSYISGSPTSDLLDWGWTDSFQNKFKTKYGLTGDLKELITTNATVRNNWLTFKKELLDDTVNMISTRVREGNPDIKISAAVMTSLSSAQSVYLQDWDKWIRSGWVDELNPMAYTADNDNLSSQLSNMLLFVQGNAEVVAGIFPEGNGGGLYMVPEQIKIVENLNIEGVSKFSSKQLFGNPLEEAFVGLHRDYIVLPTASNEELFDAYIANIIEKTSGYYQHRLDDVAFTNLISTINNFNETDTIAQKLAQILDIINQVSDETIKNRLLAEHTKINKYLSL